MTADDTTAPAAAPPIGSDGRPLRRRWQLAGTGPAVSGNAQFSSGHVPDDGGPDDAVDHQWTEPEGMLPAHLVVTGWTYGPCHREYERLWKERQAR